MNGPALALDDLARGGAARVANSMQAASTSAVVKAGRAAAPRGKTKETSQSVGKRVVQRNKAAGLIVSKIGINVGKHRKAEEVGVHEPHAHLVGMGSKPRFRKRIGGRFAYITRPTQDQLSTGTMPANDFIGQALATARPAMVAAMLNAGAKAMEREAIKAARRNRSN